MHLGSFNLPTYGVMAALGLVFGLLLIVKLGREQGIDPDKLWNLGIVAILSGVLGSKVLMILVDFGYYSAHPGEIFALSTLQAGGVWSGGLVAGNCDVCLVYAPQQHAGAGAVATSSRPALPSDTPLAASDALPPAAAGDAKPTCPGLSPSTTRWRLRS